MYDEVDWGLLVFFLGLFVIVGGAERAGLTRTLLQPVAAWNLHRIPSFVSVTALLSNVVSNVPAVMLLRTLVPAFPDPHTGWLALAMGSTLAGNLTITALSPTSSWWSGPPPPMAYTLASASTSAWAFRSRLPRWRWGWCGCG
jgi:Na+/H+ antiporter NhaD/arsenite permease-like protein